MVVKFGVFVSLFQIVTCAVHAHTGLWKDYDINDPNLTMDMVARQCQRSLMHAPDPGLVEVWCDKSYKMGNWESLHIIGLHTGDGSRYVAEVEKHVKAGDAQAIDSLAWLYSRGRFVDKDNVRGIELYNRYLNHSESTSLS
ncbi:hypothetical protein DU002_14645 [Corallincola holothuriorum]|uniref:Sel1 repeat family protein n=1 Tax=Corallincola holothuriorum TaxID=2282215 RepID=A0A368N826_9GAMM|nr:hypothetical protein [Corallincola holothuriorum]RCU45695.1 hypothetical protein DU002_14645 [Corallincola holothuriorum]